MIKYILFGSSEQECSLCGKKHHVIVYKRDMPDFPVPPTWRNRKFLTFPTWDLCCYCSNEKEYFTPAIMMNCNLKRIKRDYIKYAKSLNVKIDTSKLI